MEERLKTLEEALEKETTQRLARIAVLEGALKKLEESFKKKLAKKEEAIVSQIISQGERMGTNFNISDKQMAGLEERIRALEAKLKEKSMLGRMKKRVFGVQSSSFQNKTVW